MRANNRTLRADRRRRAIARSHEHWHGLFGPTGRGVVDARDRHSRIAMADDASAKKPLKPVEFPPVVATGADSGAVSVELSSRRTGMSFQRTRMSADRTLMSVIRTSLSLISFGFTIYQFFEHLKESNVVTGAHAARNFGAALVWLGVGMIAPESPFTSSSCWSCGERDARWPTRDSSTRRATFLRRSRSRSPFFCSCSGSPRSSACNSTPDRWARHRAQRRAKRARRVAKVASADTNQMRVAGEAESVRDR